MPSTKRLVCLANSRTLHGRCLAGREWSAAGAGRWVRPVSAREGGEVSEYERQYEDGSDPRILDVIDVPLLESRPGGYQTENWLLDPRCYWEKVGRLSTFDLKIVADGCLLCSESTPEYCHRRLVAEYLDRHWGGLQITHLG